MLEPLNGMSTKFCLEKIHLICLQNVFTFVMVFV